jgi:RNA polymerase sigma-70 factor (ECF subfamily)
MRAAAVFVTQRRPGRTHGGSPGRHRRETRVRQTLIDRIQAGDEAAVTELAAVYSSKIFGIAFRCLRSREDAEEVVQDVLLTVSRKAASFRGDALLSTWIYRVAFNAAMTRLRRRRASEPWREQGRDGDTRVVSSAASRRIAVDRDAWPDAQAQRRQLRRQLGRAIRGLPPQYRAPVA